jgi:peptidoglycan hydrolase-like protein with peptidoglycan-binding domain
MTAEIVRGAASGGRDRRGARRGPVVAAAVVIVLAGAGAAWYTAAQATSGVHAGPEEFEGVTDEVVRGTLEGSTTVAGTLRYAPASTVHAGADGTLTALAAPGEVVGRGGELAAVDDVSTLLLVGTLPAWREFGSGMEPGPDVRQLEENLRDLGHFHEEPDETFRWATSEAIMRWQASRERPQTGRLSFGEVVFAPGEIRVGTASAEVGSRVAAGTPLFETSTTEQIVEMNVRLSDQELVTAGSEVAVHLPGARIVEASVAEVGTPSEVDGANGQPQTVIPVVVRLAAADDAAGLQEASVTVEIPSERREDVLSVPVGALTALSSDSFAVEVVHGDRSTSLVPVTPGLFAGGRVEISGDVTAGQRVVVPQR